MKKLTLCILLMFGCIIKSNAQTTIEYIYDESGNRTHRTIITLQSQSPKTEEVIPPIVEQLGEQKIIVYPNPTRGMLQISISGGKNDESYTITLFNNSGLLILKDKIIGNIDYPIDLSAKSNGIYILKLGTKKDKLSFKIIKE